jgi:hypothetical protein
MKYKVIWYDREDDRGAEIMVEAASPVEAHHVATQRLSGIAHMFSPIDIECLVDEDGQFLHPEFYLTEK